MPISMPIRIFLERGTGVIGISLGKGGERNLLREEAGAHRNILRGAIGNSLERNRCP